MKKAKPPRRLEVARLRWRCDARKLGFRSTTEVECCNEIIGQPRAVAAIRLGLEIASPGYNIFVAGLTGTGKTTAIKKLLDEMDLPGGVPDDLCYVHNFRQPEAPFALRLPAGRGRILRQDLHDVIESFRRSLPEVYESEAYQTRRRRVFEDFKERGRSLFRAFETRVAAEKFQIVQIEMGPLTRAEIFPVVGGEPVAIEKLRDRADQGSFDAQELQGLQHKHGALVGEMQIVLQQGRAIERELRQALRALEREFGALVVHGPVQDLRDKYADVPRALDWLGQVEESVLESLSRFAARPEDGEGRDSEAPPSRPEFDEYHVNLAVDHSGATGPPVIIEATPTYRNLFGSIDRVPDGRGMWRSDFTKITAGSLLTANGGYLVFNLLDALGEPTVWPTLKRVLKNMKSEIQAYDPMLAFFGSSIKPEPVELNLKVILIGDAFTYHLLYAHDEEFRKIFKVKADFDSSMQRDREALHSYARFIRTLSQNEKLLPFDAAGVAAVIETGVRLAGRQTKLSTRFSDIADVVREACYWAAKEGRRQVSEAHVDRAVRERVERVNLVEHKLQEAFDTGQLLMDLRGHKIGQINALTVYDYGDHVFGRPARITSQVSMGRSGIINIEREANLSGSTHDKGVLILAGYLRAMYAQDKPLTLSASIAFEQSYGGVDGDSATAAEVFALLSAIANLPLRQDLAVSGSVDQRGELQPVGGINEKIEGFFDVCRARGLTGTQGVVIPNQNVPDLMLRKDVLEAVRKRRFHIYAAGTVDQGIEIMTGIKAGRRRGRLYEPDTVNRLVDDALYELAESIKEFVDGSDSASGRPSPQGLSDDEEDEGMEMRRRRARRRRAAAPRRTRRSP
jgi:ATP-dependent Lon protease